MFPSMVDQIYINYVKKHHYVAIIPLITKKKKGNVDFFQELKGFYRQENILFKIEYYLKNVSQKFCITHI